MFIGIDYGSKRVGIAVSDEENHMAFPLEVVARPDTLERLGALAQERHAEGFVVGESKDFSGADNPLMKDIRAFAAELQAATQLPVVFEPEFLTSAAAARQFDAAPHRAGERPVLDASAAALLLQSFLDRRAHA